MPDQTDFSGEQDPEERMQEMDRQNRERIEEELDNERESGFQGEMETEEFDLDEALSAISDGREDDQGSSKEAL